MHFDLILHWITLNMLSILQTTITLIMLSMLSEIKFPNNRISNDYSTGSIINNIVFNISHLCLKFSLNLHCLWGKMLISPTLIDFMNLHTPLPLHSLPKHTIYHFVNINFINISGLPPPSNNTESTSKCDQRSKRNLNVGNQLNDLQLMRNNEA